MTEEAEVAAEVNIEEVPEMTEEETEVAAEKITEEDPEVTEEEVEVATEEIVGEVSEVTEEEAEVTTEEIIEEVPEMTEEEVEDITEEMIEQIVEVNDEETIEFEGIIEECNEITIDDEREETETESTEEIVEEPAPVLTPPTVNIWWDARDVMDPGEPVTLHSDVIGGEGWIITYQWQCDSGDGYEDVEGANEPTYTFPASAELLSCSWRLWFDYELIPVE